VFDAPLDIPYVWIGLAAVSIAVAGTVLALPTATAPDAAGVADAIDTVAASQHGAIGTITHGASELRVRPNRISLRSAGGTSHAVLTFGPVTHAGNGSLAAVLSGESPAEAFPNLREFRSAVTRAQRESGHWMTAPAELTVRHVSWGGYDATLVG
jgi:hypothetical protein